MTITTAGFTGTVDQVDFAQLLDAVADHGVVGEYNDSSLSAAKVAGARTMLVQPGYVYAPGVLAHVDAAQNATAAAALSGSNPRIDLLVARFDWSTGLMTLVMKAGTQAASPVPPGLTQNPGVLFEVPLRQGMLTSASSGEYLASSVTERRYWLEGGKYVLADNTQLPGAKVGAVAVRPDTKQTLIRGLSGWDTYKAESDTGWSQIVAPVGGFTGGTWGRIKNGWAIISFPWVKGSTTITTPTDISRTLPAAYIPDFDLTFGCVYAESPKAPVLITMQAGSPVLTMRGVVLNGGARLQGTITYPVS